MRGVSGDRPVRPSRRGTRSTASYAVIRVEPPAELDGPFTDDMPALCRRMLTSLFDRMGSEAMSEVLAGRGYQVVKVEEQIGEGGSLRFDIAASDDLRCHYEYEPGVRCLLERHSTHLVNRGGRMAVTPVNSVDDPDEYRVIGGPRMPTGGVPCETGEQASFVAKEFGGKAQQRFAGPWVSVPQDAAD